jgi:hypothetical protein
MIDATPENLVMPWEAARRWACYALKGAAANEAIRTKTPHAEEIAPRKVTRNAAPLRSGSPRNRFAGHATRHEEFPECIPRFLLFRP